MKVIFRRWLDKCKRRILGRLDKTKNTRTFRTQFRVGKIHYEVSQRYGGIVGLSGGLIDRSQRLCAQFDGTEISAFAGDTLASALPSISIRVCPRRVQPLGGGTGRLACSAHLSGPTDRKGPGSSIPRSAGRPGLIQ